ncbi:NRDE family protein [Muricoccus radiodurans]|uniref:NRDE family protein n=1 Tax=Muricoccus radiodurans TaxID=2231721 RepID=UPI003CF9AFC3
MCTVIVLRRPGHSWPLLLAANRDERIDRPWDPPAEIAPGVLAGRDRMAGGTWMGLNALGIVAAVLNRPGTLGPAAGKRSRGELPLLALEAHTAEAAVLRLTGLDAGDWRPFNAVVADSRSAHFVRGLGSGHPEAVPLPDGVSMVTAMDPNDPASPRTRRHLPRFRGAPPPDPDRDEWSAWETLLADDGGDRLAALRVPPRDGFGTVCASLLGLAADGRAVWRFAAGPPGLTPFRDLPLPHRA